ncbi:chaperonin 10-like protein [Kockiozyma suomiensis]|uniref:chaperonin 10-like protein n=1 Tax=Kockiozyma suomiensis TaxID=1337062 RepID=UPI0033437A57
MVYPDTFQGFAGYSYEEWNKPKAFEYKPKPFGPQDIDIKIEACGVCGSDVHTITGGWGKTPLPLIVGHEIIGTAIKVGDDVKSIKVGDRVGVGAQIGSCLACDECKSGNEQYCKTIIDTYGSTYPIGYHDGSDGNVTQGGYASHIRSHELFTFLIPEQLETHLVAPMMCAGLTTYSPLKRNGCGPGKKVGIIGIGGLGHFGIQWAKALGAEVYVFSRTDSKKEDAMKLGADVFVATEKEGWSTPLKKKLDIIVCCANSSKNFDIASYLSVLKVHGHFVNVGLPEGEGYVINPMSLLGNGVYIGATHIGSKKEVLEMMDLAVEKGVRPWVETIPISEEGCAKALQKCHDNDVKYRVTLVDYEKAFGN